MARFNIKLVVFLCLVTATLVSCRSAYHDVLANDAIAIGALPMEIPNQSKRAADLELIFLETLPDCLIANVEKILYRNRQFYIKDEASIFVFSENGQYVTKLDKRGNGPDEYVVLTDFDVDENGNIYVWDVTSQKLLMYDTQLKLVSQESIDKVFIDFSLLNDRFILISRDIQSDLVFQGLEVYSIDNDQGVIIESGRKHYDDMNMLSFSQQKIFSSDNCFYYHHAFSPNLYRVDKSGNVQPFFFRDFEIAPVDVVRSYIDDPMSIRADTRYVKALTNIYENEKGIIMNVHKEEFPYFVFVSKHDYSMDYFAYLDSGLGFLTGISGVMHDRFFSVIQPHILSDENIEAFITAGDQDTETMEKLKDLAPDANPVIVSFELSN